jgi:hypothetical protein
MFQNIGHELGDKQRYPKRLHCAQIDAIHAHIGRRDVVAAEHPNEIGAKRETVTFKQSRLRRVGKQPFRRRVRMEAIYHLCELCLHLGGGWLSGAPRQRDCDQLKVIDMTMVQFTYEDECLPGPGRRRDRHANFLASRSPNTAVKDRPARRS